MLFAALLLFLCAERASALSVTRRSSGSTGFRSWEEAHAKASDILAKLTAGEKRNLVRGSHFRWLKVAPEVGYYTGNTEAIPRLGIPALKMQDAGQGFRPTNPGEDGTTTSWPCLLSLASTWDEDLVGRVAAAIGQEFAGKGANVMLGPSVNVHRVAKNGRNFEYISGEDPYLGTRLVDDFIQGVQNQGVIACVKHYAFNEQETDRMSQDSRVDARTAWELYYPPFEAAVKAGAGAFMCSYNKVNGTYACENDGVLNQDLKQQMGFQGIVMSDWAATHSARALTKGLDMEMPGLDSSIGEITAHFTDRRISKDHVPQSAEDAAARRVLSTIFRLRLDEKDSCLPPKCNNERERDQTSKAHAELAREAATSSVTLLQNDGVLPLDTRRIRKLGVVGRVAMLKQGEQNTDYYSGSGSGRVPGKYVVTPLAGIQSRAERASVPVVDGTAARPDSVASLMEQVDAIVVFVGAMSGEGGDRRSLNLDNAADELIRAAARTGKPTVVCMQTPGAVLTPWRGEVSAIANLFLGGQETGSAWAAVLFGDAAPVGRLPINLPASGADVIEPGRGQVVYGEGLFTSYRSPSLRAAFPFGHGLSYTNFSYGAPEALAGGTPACPAAACVRTAVTNTGARPGVEVPQAYVEFGAGAWEPARLLRGFEKTRVLEPGQAQTVLFALTRRDLSVYSPADGWVPQRQARVHVGSSSSDSRGSTLVAL